MDKGARRDQDMQDMKVIDETRGSVGQKLDELEAQAQGTVAEEAKVAVHEIRNQAQRAADQLVNQVGGFWGQAQRALEVQARQHPWLVVGSLLLIWYLVARKQDSRVGSESGTGT